jgi:hypothetical protein
MLMLWLRFEVTKFEIDDGADLIASVPGGLAHVDVQVKTAQRAEVTGNQLRKALDNLDQGRPYVLLRLDPVYPHDPVEWVLLSRWVQQVPELASAARLPANAKKGYSPPAASWTRFPQSPGSWPEDFVHALHAELLDVGNRVAAGNELYALQIARALARPEELPFMEATQRQVRAARERVYGDGRRFEGTAEQEVKEELASALQQTTGQAASPRDRARTIACVQRFFNALEQVERGHCSEALAALPDYHRVDLGVWRYLLANTGTARRLVDLAVQKAADLSPSRLRALMGVLSGLAVANDKAAGYVGDKLAALRPLRALDELKVRDPVDHLATLGQRLGTPNGLDRTAFDVFRQWEFSMLEARGEVVYADRYRQLSSRTSARTAMSGTCRTGVSTTAWESPNWRR